MSTIARWLRRQKTRFDLWRLQIGIERAIGTGRLARATRPAVPRRDRTGSLT